MTCNKHHSEQNYRSPNHYSGEGVNISAQSDERTHTGSSDEDFRSHEISSGRNSDEGSSTVFLEQKSNTLDT